MNPHLQVLWALAAISRSKVPHRREVALEIVSAARKKAVGEASKTVFAKFNGLVDQLIGLANHTPTTKAKCVHAQALCIIMGYNTLYPALSIDVSVSTGLGRGRGGEGGPECRGLWETCGEPRALGPVPLQHGVWRQHAGCSPACRFKSLNTSFRSCPVCAQGLQTEHRVPVPGPHAPHRHHDPRPGAHTVPLTLYLCSVCSL